MYIYAYLKNLMHADVNAGNARPLALRAFFEACSAKVDYNGTF